MLTQEQLTEWFLLNNLAPNTRDLIQEIASSEPVRKVQSGRGNVSGTYPSRKMGVTIQFESHTVELPAIYEMEYDHNILAYYDQPNYVYMEYQSKSGRSVKHNSTPDFFVIKSNQAGWEEWKTEEELEKISEDSPNRYVKDENNIWRCPPGEKYAEKFGLTFTVRSSKEINWIFQRNIKLIEEYINEGYLELLSEEKINFTHNMVKNNYGITLEELVSSNENLKLEDVFIMIAEGLIYADIRKVILIETDNVRLFKDKKLAKIYYKAFVSTQQADGCHWSLKSNGLALGSSFLMDGNQYKIVNFGLTNITAQNSDQQMIHIPIDNMRTLLEENIVKLLDENIDETFKKHNEYKSSIMEEASISDIEEAYKRLNIITNQVKEHGYSEKTIRRWRKAFEEGVSLYGNGFLGLIPNKKNRGNNKIKLDMRVNALIEDLITKHYLTHKQMNITAVYHLLKDECREQDLPCPSYVTLTKRIKALPSVNKTKERKGKRAAYQLEQWRLEQNTAKHGDVPFEIAHIDHTELDIELVLTNLDSKYTMRPYLTLLIDAYSRVILAHYITFDPPSYRSNMMALRECVRKYKQLPRTIVVDGGKEFHSKHFDFLCAQFEITKKTRPPAQARFGSVIERLFGTTNTKFIHNLQGNTQITKEVRQVTKSVNPKGKALWTLKTLDKMFYKWIEHYHGQLHSGVGMTPQEQFELGMSVRGSRQLNYIEYDENFILATLPTTPREKGLVQVGKGVVYNNIWYWNDEFRSCEREKVPLKYDPFDVGILYAYVNKRWIKCISDHHYLLKGRSHKEIQIITEEIRKKRKNKNSITAREIVSFINSIEENERALKQLAKDSAKDEKDVKEVENHSIKPIKGEVNIDSIPIFEVYEGEEE